MKTKGNVMGNIKRTILKAYLCINSYAICLGIRKSNNLRIFNILCYIHKVLHKGTNQKICDALSALDQTYILPGKDEGENEYSEATHQGLKELNEYLGILDLCGKLVRSGSVDRNTIISLLNTRLEDIKAHKDLSEHIKEINSPYGNLRWLLWYQ